MLLPSAHLPPHLIQLLLLLLPLKVLQDAVGHHLGEVHPNLQKGDCPAVSISWAQKIESHLDILNLSVVVTHLECSGKLFKMFWSRSYVQLNLLSPVHFNNLSRCTLQRLENGHLFYWMGRTLIGCSDQHFRAVQCECSQNVHWTMAVGFPN